MFARKKLLVNEIPDRLMQENFRRIEDTFRNDILLGAQLRLIELTFVSDITDFLYAHQLGFQPTDLWQTSKKGAGSVVYNYADFTDEVISLTTSGTSSSNPLMIRLLVGRIG